MAHGVDHADPVAISGTIPAPSAPIAADVAWAAFVRRDRAYDGRFVVTVSSTRIYCRPSCAARRPRREHVGFLPDGAAARAAGYRACRRCLPDDVTRDATAVRRALTLLDDAERPLSLADLAASVGYAPHHFQRLFTRATGLSPAAYARDRRAARAVAALRAERNVTAAIYAAGYAAPSRFYADTAALGMAPTAWASGGAGERVAWCVLPSPLGALLVAHTGRGLCHVAFDEGVEALAALLPAATLVEADPGEQARALHWLETAAVPLDAALPETQRRALFLAAVRAAAREEGQTYRVLLRLPETGG
ncbi:Ada metal-binding domain-containing protein [Sphingomonas sp. BK345]|uniref:Ada metal-binding domain-containing protein n=1 Tax=unclassified Sphingomonas TaxID=196159 RepID=UPI0018148E80|nr:AraC family transcriptional regulator of adaptative response/methylated-DNA-[protein]-cysteine methyltransferase [Sphingomonas sp. BK069]MBB3474784.1 AraC family transcriptional regulator of adaptative response/methylated-DNA-[protein]-cysteine methyltransferase [Sphingomonas sp. BK345]